ncbi:hypothetical protein CH63R_01050 [Colletotrichum higginsianum IMI 349063]|uniref:Uncharacterized protein n=1 Tax=Colletotrichum higginsianum (strain IMI 349063) TaxID=759273 RepID=A0A1B7YUZ4_COLHI|nr:hypothetical protein CH63R_01050 [Colletotrichum higginsianum IMI 349063]OBR15870.1 hypothetical protein CH63R_01050 [Colletotrichum higginsianum IMI 349063]
MKDERVSDSRLSQVRPGERVANFPNRKVRMDHVCWNTIWLGSINKSNQIKREDKKAVVAVKANMPMVLQIHRFPTSRQPLHSHAARRICSKRVSEFAGTVRCTSDSEGLAPV